VLSGGSVGGVLWQARTRIDRVPKFTSSSVDTGNVDILAVTLSRPCNTAPGDDGGVSKGSLCDRATAGNTMKTSAIAAVHSHNLRIGVVRTNPLTILAWPER